MPFWKNLLSGGGGSSGSGSGSSKDTSSSAPSSPSQSSSNRRGLVSLGGGPAAALAGSASSSSSVSSSGNAKRPSSSSGALGSSNAGNSSSHSSLVGRQSGAQTPTPASNSAPYSNLSQEYVASRLSGVSLSSSSPSAGPVNIPSAVAGGRPSAPNDNDNRSSSRNPLDNGNGVAATAARPSSSGGMSAGQQPASIGSTTYSVTSSSIPTSTASTSLSNSNENDDDAEETSIPDTPYSSGHSPSHARHRFPHADQASPSTQSFGLTSGTSDTDSPQQYPKELQEFDQKTASAPGTGGIGNRASVSSLSSNNNGKTDGITPQASLPRLDIPTTHTILANPLPQTASGLTSALSAVLPSALSSNSTSAAYASAGRAGNSSSSAIGPGGAATGFDIDDMIGRLLEAGYSSKLTKSVCLKNNEITAICSAAREVFLSQPTLIELSPPVKIVGDVHGQYWDLIRLFEMCGFPPKSNYLFLGDYVDRGKQSLETILLLLCYKVKYPENFFLLRGNHECANVTRVYGFYDECKRRCNIKVWKTFVDVFNCLPITALVAGKIFCVHGGLSPSLSTMDDIRRIARPTDVPDYGLLNDLLWSDPSDTALDWEDNERGVSYCFGKAVIQDFLAKYDFDLICRAHMVVEDGYEFWNERTLVTIFSAPNYCGEFDNFAATMSVSEDLLCAFELLKPLDGAALKKELLKCKRKNSAAVAAGKPSNSGF